jgi:8-amino-7-oxononanoate synthase
VSEFERELQSRLATIREQGLHRELRRIDSAQGPRIQVAAQTLLNFSSNDYLGLASHPAVREAAFQAIAKFGTGSGASRLLCGSLAPHHELEEAIAAFKGVEAALSFSSGYAAAVGTICALLGKDDVIVVDKLIHACLVDAARLSGAKIRIFAHNDLHDLEDILKWATKNQSAITNRQSAILVVTESIFSMDGDAAPLREIVALKEKYGAWLMVDEAHATGLYGENRRGLAEELGVSDRIEVQMGTLGKALGASGGYICGSRRLVDFLVNRARSFIFSTAPVPAAAGAATVSIRLVQSTEGQRLCATLWRRVEECRTGVAPVCDSLADSSGKHNGNRRDACPTPSAILPVILGDETAAVAVATKLREQGFFVPAIRYPTVARGSARLRITLTAAHAVEDIEALIRALREIVNRKS